MLNQENEILSLESPANVMLSSLGLLYDQPKNSIHSLQSRYRQQKPGNHESAGTGLP